MINNLIDLPLFNEYKPYWEQLNIDSNYVPLMNHAFFDDSMNIDLNDNERKFKYLYYIYAHLIEKFNIKTKNKTLLDIGCGYGKGVDFLKRKYGFSRAFGIDVMMNHIFVAEQIYRDINFITLDVRYLNLLNLKVDVVTSVESLCYYCDCDSFYIGLYNVLKNSGDAIISTTSTPEIASRIVEKFKKHNFRIVELKDVTENVINGSIMQTKLFEEENKIDNKYSMERNTLYKVINKYKNQELLYLTFHVKKIYV